MALQDVPYYWQRETSYFPSETHEETYLIGTKHNMDFSQLLIGQYNIL